MPILSESLTEVLSFTYYNVSFLGDRASQIRHARPSVIYGMRDIHRSDSDADLPLLVFLTCGQYCI